MHTWMQVPTASRAATADALTRMAREGGLVEPDEGPVLARIDDAMGATKRLAPHEVHYVRLSLDRRLAYDLVAFRTTDGILLQARLAKAQTAGLDQLAMVYSSLARSRDAVVFTDASGTLLGASARWCALYGFHPRDVLGANPRVINSRQHPRSYFRDLWLSLTDRKVGTWSGELVNRGCSGDLVTVWQTITTFRDGQGAIAGYLGITRDMTAYRELRDRLARSNRELRERGQRNEEVLAMTVHDLKSPLLALVGFVDLAARQVAQTPQPEIAEYLARAKDAGRRMETLIHTILDAEQARSGHFELAPTRVSVRSLVRAEIDLHRAHAGRQGVTITLAEEGPVLPTFADELRLAEALANVLSNAIKFSPTDGTVRVSHRSDAIGNHEIVVEDDGPGIPLDERQQVFDLLYQADGGRASVRGRRGSGWGLFIARQVMTLHDGSIAAETAAGGGCRMVLRFGPLWRLWDSRPWAVAVFDPDESLWPQVVRALGRGLPVFAAHREAELLELGNHELPNIILHPPGISMPAVASAGWRPGNDGVTLLPSILTVEPGGFAPGLRIVEQQGPPALAEATRELLSAIPDRGGA
jgi:PAS domain S-box-containing protein